MNYDLYTILEYIAVALGIICVFLQTKENIWAWPAGLVSVVLYVIIFRNSFLYSDMVLHFIYIILNAYGWWSWGKKKGGNELIKVQKLPLKGIQLTIGIVIIGTVIWGFLFMTYTKAQLVYFDAFTTIGSLVAQYLLVKKYIENWLLWIIVDVVAVNVYIYKGLYPTAFLFGVFIILCIFGWLQWRKKINPPSSSLIESFDH